ncbi:phosphoribosylglycinamide formyltransferase [Helicobacter burdigaliensis]|uniref:phosphoribosylglycinamide formyltransferase n=1 Tax=Helicobacter burdigaliensis TaxID=2315334 RepID=UPI000EF6A509|nr:phosphoribosylglycinamide formyltransferase [Helicobacter burdigaliensis]
MIKRIAILFSGNGSNLEALIKALHNRWFKKSGNAFKKEQEGFIIGGIRDDFIEAKEGESGAFKIEVILALSNKIEAYGLVRAKNLGVKTQVIESKGKAREEFDRELVGVLKPLGLDLCVLAGFMRILTPVFTTQINAINIHPSLLPLFKGAHGIEESFKSSMKVGGVSVHRVSEELDGGELIAQAVMAKEGMSLENYEEKIHKIEHILYPLAVLEELSNER